MTSAPVTALSKAARGCVGVQVALARAERLCVVGVNLTTGARLLQRTLDQLRRNVRVHAVAERSQGARDRNGADLNALTLWNIGMVKNNPRGHSETPSPK